MSDDEKRAKLRNNLWFGYIVFLIMWTGCVYTELAHMNSEHKLFAFYLDKEGKQPCISDFVNVYNSAQLAAAAQREKIDIYSPTLQAEYSLKLTAPVKPETPFYLQYPPFLFAIVRPLAVFDMLGAWVTWSGLGLVAVITAAAFLTRGSAASLVEPKAEKTIMGVGAFTMIFAVVAAVASFPCWYSVRLGQTSLLLAPGLAAFFLMCQKRKYFLAGLASGVVMIKLQYLPAIFIIGALLGNWPFLGGFTLIGLILLGLSVAIVGLDNVMRFPEALLKGESSQGVSGVAAEQMQNVRGMFTLLMGGDNNLVHLLSIGFFGLAMLGLIVLWWRERKLDTTTAAGAARFRVLASISTILMLAVSPHCHMQDYLAMVIPCIWLWFEIARRPEFKFAPVIRWLILGFPIFGWPFYVLLFLFQLAKIQPFYVWAVLLMVYSFRFYFYIRREDVK